MKLLGKWGNKKSESNGNSPSRSISGNVPPADITDNNRTSLADTSTNGDKHRRKKKDSRGNSSTKTPHNLPGRPNLSRGGSSLISIPRNDDDTNTIDALTLYEWSVADNAPSIGSAAEIFLNHGRSKDKDNTGHNEGGEGGDGAAGVDVGRNRNLSSQRNYSYTSSSDGEDEYNHDDNDKDENLNFQYCKLTDSPPPKQAKSIPKSGPKMSIFGMRFKSATPFESEQPSAESRSTTPSPKKARNPNGIGGSNPSTPQRRCSSTSSADHTMKSPKDIKAKMQRSVPPTIPLQTLRRSNGSNPIDVDSFMEDEENTSFIEHEAGKDSGAVEIVMQERRCSIQVNHVVDDRPLPAELKGRIHALSFEEDNLNSSLESGISFSPGSRSGSRYRESSTDVTADADVSSVKNVGDENSPFMRYRKGDGVNQQTFVKKEVGANTKNNLMKIDTNVNTPTSIDSYPLDTFSSTRNLGDMNSPPVPFQKRVSLEPDFTFSINSTGDSGDSDNTGATAWLLRKERDSSGSGGEGDEHANSNVSIYLQSSTSDGTCSGWEAVPFPEELRDSRSISSSAVASVGGTCSEPISTSSAGGKRFRKNIKDQMKNKFQSIVKKKTKDKEREKDQSRSSADSADINGSRIEKLKFRREQSVSSMAPLTGIENHAWIHGKRKDKDIEQEIQRRKAIERREIERKQLQRRYKDTDRGKPEALTNERAINDSRTDQAKASSVDDTTSAEKIKNIKKLQNWVMGGTPRYDVDDRAEATASSNLYSSHLMPAMYYEEESTLSVRSPHTQVTDVIDNTSKSKAFHVFEPNFPDEDSTAQTPEACAPLAHQDFSCVLCKKGDRTHLAVPCMHFSFCSDCVSDMEKKHEATGMDLRCSVCDEKTTAFSKVFY